MQGAAFFDLDRTLLQGGTGPLLSRAMYDLGVVTRKLPGEKILYGVFDKLGETLPSIFLARQATLVAKGREVGTFDEAAKHAAEAIAELIHPFAHSLIEQHKREGRPVVLATTTPQHLIQPLADMLGFDHVIATRYGESADGRYDGSLRGPFVWSVGKLSAVKHFAERHDISLKESYAYSDSIFDTPLLNAVGHPAAVNPDPRMTLFAIARRWPIVHFDVSPGTLKIPVIGLELQKLVLWSWRPELFPYARFDVAGVENIPRTGPVILVGNHRSYFDVVAIGQMMRQTGRTLRMLGKKEVFETPLFGSFASAVGGIRVDRGENGQESFDMAAVALEGGEMVGLLPEGTIPRGEEFFDPELNGKTGAARLAELTRAPVIPFGMWGTEKVWPRSSTLPNVLNVKNPPTIRIRVGEPVELGYESAEADTATIMAAIRACLPAEAQERRTPTPDELRSTYPGGRVDARPAPGLPGRRAALADGPKPSPTRPARPTTAARPATKRTAKAATEKTTVKKAASTATAAKPAVKKSAAKPAKQAPAKPASRKTAQKAATTTAKTAATKKTVAKKTTVKKTAAKKTATKKVAAAPKSAAKKSVAKKSAAKATTKAAKRPRS
jgi:putative phosphoserine phosphatase/1-acylglycerol-3-phosphate O-acyltransferase